MASANSNDKLIIFKGDDTGGVFGRRLAFTIEAGDGVDLSGCRAEWIFDGIVKTFAAPLIPGEVREVFYSHNETRCMALGVRYGTFRIIDASGKVRTLTNTKPVEVTNNADRCYPGASAASFVVHGIGDMKHSEFADLEEKEGMTLNEVGGMVNTLIRKLKGTVSAFAALLAFGAFADGAITPQTDFGDINPTAKISTVISDAGAVMTETDPTVPAWAKQPNPPGGMTDNALVLTNGAVVTKDGQKTIGAADVGAVPLVDDDFGGKTAVTIGSRHPESSVGQYSLANGDGVSADGIGTHAEGYLTTAWGVYSHASGVKSLTKNGHKYAYAWNGDETRTAPYTSNGPGTFNINPAGGLSGFWIGAQTLASIISSQGMSNNALVLTNGSVKTKSGTEITPSDMGAAAAGDVEKLNIGYTRLYNFSLGSTNANFTATNYPPTKAEADARCHFKVEPGMDFSNVPASLQLNEYRDGERRTVVDTRDWTVWYFKFKERQLTNEIARLRAENVVLSNKVEAAKSWADRTANGVDNPMTDTVVVDRPNLWLMADYEWQKVVSGSNQCFVIRAKNVALSGGGNTNGFLEVVDAFGKPYMRINKSAETFADPVFDEIYWDKSEGAWYVVFANSTKPTKGGANVAIRGNGDGKCIFFEEADPECPAVITWPDVPESHSGHWIMKAVPKPIDGVVPRNMFFGAEIKVHGSDYVEYLKEASFGAGVRFGNNVYDYVESGDQLILRKRQ